MKQYFASIEDFNDMDLDDQIKTFNRFIESQNRQIRRLRAKHPDLLEEYPGLSDLGRRNLPKITKREAGQFAAMGAKKAGPLIMMRYQGMRSRVGEEGVSVKAAQALREDRLDMEEEYGFDDLSPAEAEYLRGKEQYIRSRSAQYYELMQYGVKVGYWKDLQEASAALEEKYVPEGEEGRSTWMYEHRSINAWLRAQGRSDEITARNRRELMNRAIDRILDRDQELITGQYSRKPRTRTGNYDMSKWGKGSTRSEKANKVKRKKGKV